ncbi:MAG: nuclease-related domain-containing protein [Pseudomonadota bacterium]
MKAKEKKSPIKAPPLRNPGQSLDEEIDRLINDKGSQYAIIIVVPIMLAALEWYRSLTGATLNPLVFTIIAVICAMWGLYKLSQLRPRVRALKQGRDGEKAVGQYLEQLRVHGYRVFHDIVGDSFNIDHVIICTKGVFTVETKTYSKPARGEAVIRHQTNSIIIDGFDSGSDILVQAKAEANWLGTLLNEMSGKKWQVKPVVVFPGWYIDSRTAGNDVRVLNPKALPTYIDNSPVCLTQDDVSLLAYSLSRHVRNDERASSK